MLQSLILIDPLFLLNGGRRREGKKKKRSVFEFFSAPNMTAVIILVRSSRNYPSVSLTSQGDFWSHGSCAFCFHTLFAILDSKENIEIK
jgi:hypothetical protein